MSLRWHHSPRASSLCNAYGVCLGEVYRTWKAGPHVGLPWGCYAQHGGGGNSGQHHAGYFPTRAAAMRVAASACDRKKFP